MSIDEVPKVETTEEVWDIEGEETLRPLLTAFNFLQPGDVVRLTNTRLYGIFPSNEVDDSGEGLIATIKEKMAGEDIRQHWNHLKLPSIALLDAVPTKTGPYCYWISAGNVSAWRRPKR